MGKLETKVALVIGGAGGMGRAACETLVMQGARVVVADINGEAAAQVADALNGERVAAVSYTVDASSVDEMEELVGFVERQFGRLDVLFCNAGMHGPDTFDISEQHFEKMIALNVKGSFFLTNRAAPLLEKDGGGSIIYMSSIAGLSASEKNPLYCITKNAILMMMRSFARHLGPRGIRANAICPGHVQTDFPRRWSGLEEGDYLALIEKMGAQLPMGRVGQPADIAELVCFLASDQSKYLTGLTIPVDGGRTM